MRIGLSGGGSSVERMVDQAKRAEDDGFTSLWYASAVAGDPLVAMAFAGRATSSIELGTAVLPTYTAHPVLQVNRVVAAASAMGRSGLTLGLGPSHRPTIEGMYGLSYDSPGEHTEEYVTVVTALLRGETVDFEGRQLRVHAAGPAAASEVDVPVLVAALAPRMLRVAGELTDGTVLWMANEAAIDSHVRPRITSASAAAGRDVPPRIVAGLPVAGHDDVAEARRTAARLFEVYGQLPNYRRILDLGGAAGPEDAAIVGDEDAVAGRIEALFRAGATDVWAAVFPVGDDAAASRRRTRSLLTRLAAT